MSNPLTQLQALRRSVQQMVPDEKREYHDAKKAMQAVIDAHGDLAKLAALEISLELATLRGDV